jgi:hypothetical protein
MSKSSQQDLWERVTVAGDQLADKVGELIREGNVRRLVIKHGENTVLEIPVTLGIIGAALAPALAAVAAVGALVTHCTVEVERAETGAEQDRTKEGSTAAGEETV